MRTVQDTYGAVSGRENCRDNAAAQSFFRLLNIERVSRKIYHSSGEGKSDVFDCIEMFYNYKRLRGASRGLSPVEFD